MPQTTGIKEKFSISLAPYYKNKIDEYVERGMFGSRSEFMSIAALKLCEALDREEWEKTIGSKEDVVMKVFQATMNEISRRVHEDQLIHVTQE